MMLSGEPSRWVGEFVALGQQVHLLEKKVDGESRFLCTFESGAPLAALSLDVSTPTTLRLAKGEVLIDAFGVKGLEPDLLTSGYFEDTGRAVKVQERDALVWRLRTPKPMPGIVAGPPVKAAQAKVKGK